MYDGYLRFGSVDVINDARTHTYSHGVMKCTACEGLAEAAGSPFGYTNPTADQAPWAVGNNQGACFSGLMISKWTGLYDATRRLSVTEKIGRGGVPTGGRNGSRTVGVTARALATTDAAMDVGMEWLVQTLTGDCDTGDCAGASVHMFAACPDLCEGIPDTNAVVVTTLLTTEASGWTATLGTLNDDVPDRVTWVA